MPELYEIPCALILGTGTVLLGRWMYKNPKRTYPNWLYSNPDHPALIGRARAIATFFIFAGLWIALAGVGSRLLPNSWVPVLLILGGIVGAWYLRPKVPETAVGEGLDTAAKTKRSGFLSTKGKWVVGISLAVAVLFFFGLVVLIGNSEVCQLAMQRTQSNSVAIERLGTPIKKGLVISGSIKITGPSGHADIAIPVSGPKAKGTLYAVGEKSAGRWKFETLQLAIAGDSNRVDLSESSDSKSVQP